MSDVLSDRERDELAGAIRRSFAGYRAPARDLAALERPAAVGRTRLLALSGTAAAAVLVIGVMLIQSLAVPTSVFAGWTAVPSSPDPALSLVADAACRQAMTDTPPDGSSDLASPGLAPSPPKGPDASSMPLVALDQRGNVALALFSDGRTFASCVVTREGLGGYTAVGVGTIEGPRVGALRVLSGVSFEGRQPLRMVVGDAADEVAAVTLLRDDGLEVRATLAAGYFLAWWPTDGGVISITGLDRSGALVDTLIGDIFD